MLLPTHSLPYRTLPRWSGALTLVLLVAMALNASPARRCGPASPSNQTTAANSSALTPTR